MFDTDLNNFIDEWNATLESKGSKPLSDRAMTMIFEDLSMYEFKDIKNALRRFRLNPDEGMYNLQPAAIMKLLEGDSDSAAMQAWNLARKIARSHGWSRDLVLGDKILMKCIDEIGYQRLCTQKDDVSLDILGQQLRTLYKKYRINGFNSCPEILQGHDNTQRQQHGLQKIAPLMLSIDGQVGNQRPRIAKHSLDRYHELKALPPVSKEEVQENLNKLMASIGEKVGEE